MVELSTLKLLSVPEEVMVSGVSGFALTELLLPERNATTLPNKLTVASVKYVATSHTPEIVAVI